MTLIIAIASVQTTILEYLRSFANLRPSLRPHNSAAKTEQFPTKEKNKIVITNLTPEAALPYALHCTVRVDQTKIQF